MISDLKSGATNVRINKLLVIFVVLVGSFMVPLTVDAHLPRVVTGSGVVHVQNPEISQAFYGELKGQARSYQINAQDPFTLYVGILVPKLPGIEQDVSVKVSLLEPSQLAAGNQKPTVFFVLNGQKYKWTPFYENFAGDNYYQGPDWKSQAGPGFYQLVVSSPDNRGKYVLVVGSKESFSPKEMLKTIQTLPGLKQNFFGKSVFWAFLNLTGLFMMLAIAGSVAITVFILSFLKKLFRKWQGSKKPKAVL
ncbi:MAG TPA: hypothetical protein DEP98_05245 [Candidatus Jacksonbacteria bacterium]|nr:hypothetical protein [Candidatus Jacksonbacteria bacterium]